ncbi:MAG: hypothetical protein LBS99_04225 [Clostridiales bacterium]|jgi:hypothetical protein|nr:hypothetical protein [Clostridiales bacterium]
MKPKIKRIISVIALVFMGVFTVGLIVSVTVGWGGIPALDYATIGSGAVGVVLWFVIYMEQKKISNTEKERELMELKAAVAEKEAEKQAEKNGGEDAASEPAPEPKK